MGWTSRLSARHFFIFLHGPQYAPLKQDSYNWTNSLFSQSFNDPEMRRNRDVQEMKSLWVPPRRHSNTQLPQQLVMTSDWWWQWRSLLWKNVLGQFLVSLPLHVCNVQSFARFCNLSFALACWDSSAGTLMIRHMWWFPKKGEVWSWGRLFMLVFIWFYELPDPHSSQWRQGGRWFSSSAL